MQEYIRDAQAMVRSNAWVAFPHRTNAVGLFLYTDVSWQIGRFPEQDTGKIQCFSNKAQAPADGGGPRRALELI
jgi:hypothetical protein